MEITDSTIRFGRRVAIFESENSDEVLMGCKRDVDQKISDVIGVGNFEAVYKFHKFPPLHNEIYLPREYKFVMVEAYVNPLKEIGI